MYRRPGRPIAPTLRKLQEAQSKTRQESPPSAQKNIFRSGHLCCACILCLHPLFELLTRRSHKPSDDDDDDDDRNSNRLPHHFASKEIAVPGISNLSKTSRSVQGALEQILVFPTAFEKRQEQVTRPGQKTNAHSKSILSRERKQATTIFLKRRFVFLGYFLKECRYY